MDDTLSLTVNTLFAGIMLGGFFAATALGVTIAFGMLNIVNIAHPAFVLLGAYLAILFNRWLSMDPFVAGLALAPLFFLAGYAVYRIYYLCFERSGQDALRGLVFFFGLLFLIEAFLIVAFGVDYQSVHASYTDEILRWGSLAVPLRILVPFGVSLAMIVLLRQFLKRTFFGRAVMAVAQDPVALRLMGTSPTGIKSCALGLATATAAISGAMLVVIQPIQPALGREYIGMVFAVCILGGMGSLYGALAGAVILGIAETTTATFFGPSWAPATAFGLLLLTLAFRPSGLFSR